MKRRPGAIHATFALFPTISHMKRTPNGRTLWVSAFVLPDVLLQIDLTLRTVVLHHSSHNNFPFLLILAHHFLPASTSLLALARLPTKDTFALSRLHKGDRSLPLHGKGGDGDDHDARQEIARERKGPAKDRIWSEGWLGGQEWEGSAGGAWRRVAEGGEAERFRRSARIFDLAGGLCCHCCCV